MNKPEAEDGTGIPLLRPALRIEAEELCAEGSKNQGNRK
jgi:hypothetical protein